MLKVTLHETIRNDDFKRKKASQHCRDTVSNGCNVVPNPKTAVFKNKIDPGPDPAYY